jgi:SdrD B-like domain
MNRFKLVLTLCLFALVNGQVAAQIQGKVFRDFNANGKFDSTAAFKEVGLKGISVTAYNAAGTAVGTTTTNTTGNYTIAGVSGALRVEFTGMSAYDFPAPKGTNSKTSIQFVTAPTTGISYGVNYPSEYVETTNPSVYVPCYNNGNPLGGGNAGTKDWFVKFPYGNMDYDAPTAHVDGATIGTTYGVAYSKQAGKVFTSAFLKRHTGFGTLGSGGIYVIDTNLTATTAFYDLDAHSYATRCASGCPTYGVGSSFNITTDAAGFQVLNYVGNGLGVVGTNVERGLPSATTDPSNDAAAYDQVGKVGLGDLDVSDDGKTLFTTNLYDRKLYLLSLNSAAQPTTVTAVSAFSLPNPPLRAASGLANAANTYTGVTNGSDFYDGTVGYQRPFALKVYKGKVFVGAVTTGEHNGVTVMDNNTGNPEYTDLWAYIWSFDLATQTFATTPVLQLPLNFNRRVNGDNADETFRVWQHKLGFFSDWPDTYVPQPMLTDIEIDATGSMILGIRDRYGDQTGYENYRLSGTDTYTGIADGEILRAYYNSTTNGFELETNGKEGANSSKSITSGSNNNEGPGGGEFYYQDNEQVSGLSYHLNTCMGSLAILPSSDQVLLTIMDPVDLWAGGLSKFNNTDGTRVENYQLYAGADIQLAGKANGLGDIELFGGLQPLEIGNRVWADANFNGIQDAGESGLSSITVTLYKAGVQVGSTVTASDGTYYFNQANVTLNGATGILPNTAYEIRISTGQVGLVGRTLSVSPAGTSDAINNDGTISGLIVSKSFTTGNAGENNHYYDFGFQLGCPVNICFPVMVVRQ